MCECLRKGEIEGEKEREREGGGGREIGGWAGTEISVCFGRHCCT